jgi:uncharacterized membrane protein
MDFFPLLLTLLPWIELRGSIPAGIAAGMDPWFVLGAAIVLNIALFFPNWIGLEKGYSKIKRWRIVRKIVTKIKRKAVTIDPRHRTFGLALFIGIPLPFTGVYSGTLVAWLLGMDWKHALAGVIAGVLIAATIVFGICMGVLSLLL